MLRSKSRSGALDFGAKHHSSLFSRTLSSSKICRGDPLIHREALVPIERRPSAKIISSSENQLVRVSTMQRQMGRLEEELKLTKDQLDVAGEDRDRALDQLQDTKIMVHEANTKLSEALSPRRAGKLSAELTTMKEMLSNSQKELAAKEKKIESMKSELEQVETKSVDKVSSSSNLNEELHNAKVSESRAVDLYSESKKRIIELEADLEKRKQSEKKVLESGVCQTKELEAAKIELQESKLEIASLREQLHKLESSSDGVHKSDHIYHKNEMSEKSDSPKAVDLQNEIGFLKKELKAAIEGEEQSVKAMNDLALALKEVATEGNYTKEKLLSREVELQHIKEEAEQLKVMARSTEDKYQKIVCELKKETELHKNTADRLRVEAEESHMAWNGKEMGFVGVIKEVEEEKARTQQENVKLSESLKANENLNRTAREENHKLRDILKQALNEANVAKEAASIAREENSQLKDELADKEETLEFLTRENEKLRISEAAANEKMKELKRLLSQAYSELKTEEKEDCGTAFMSPESIFDDHKEEFNREEAAIKKGFSFDLHKIKLHNKYEDADDMLVEEDPVKAEALKGSIFDTSTESPRSEPHTPKRRQNRKHHRRRSSMPDVGIENADNNDPLDGTHQSENSHHDSEGTHSEDSEGDRRTHRRRKSVLLKTFGYLLMRRSFSGHSRKEPTTPTPVLSPGSTPSATPGTTPDRL